MTTDRATLLLKLTHVLEEAENLLAEVARLEMPPREAQLLREVLLRVRRRAEGLAAGEGKERGH